MGMPLLPTPTGSCLVAQGCSLRATLGHGSGRSLNPNWVAAASEDNPTSIPDVPFVPSQIMPPEQSSELVLERHLLVMLNLFVDVFDDGHNL